MTGDGVDWGSTLCAALNVLREEEAFCDTTVVGNDQKTHRAHACVLATASPTLKTYLKQATGNTYVVRVDHMSSSTWKGVLQFAYTGQVVITSGSSVASLSKAASTLQIRGLQMALLSQSSVRRTTSKETLPEYIVVRRRQPPAHNTEASGMGAVTVLKAASALQVRRLQTTLLSQTNLKTAAAEKPVELVAGEKEVEEPCVASELDDDDRGEAALSSADDGTSAVRWATAKKTVSKRKRMLRRQMRAHDAKTPEAVSDVYGDIKSEHKSDDDTTQRGTSEVNKLVTAIDGDIKSENESGDDAIQTGTSEVNKSVTAIDIKSEHESGDDATQTGTSNVDKSITTTDNFIKSEHIRVGNAKETENTNGVNKSAIAVDGDTTEHKSGNSAAETDGVSEVNKLAIAVDGDISEHKSDGSAVETKGASEVNKSARRRNSRPTCLCNVCGKVLAPGSLARHMFLHGDGEKPYQCDTCHAGFVALHALRKHSRVHTGEKPYRCHVCGKAFSSSATLPYHMKIHTGEKPYVCDICECAFRSQNAMTVHRRTHTGEKPYTCNVCSKSFVTANRRNRHAWMHEGRKPYHCDFCDKTYTSSTKLKVHRRTHTGEKPFMCELCGQLFSRQTSMKTHVAGHSKLLRRDLCVQSLAQQKVQHMQVVLDSSEMCVAPVTNIEHFPK